MKPPDLQDLQDLVARVASTVDPGPHPDDAVLAAWIDGALDATSAAAVEGHCASCAECRQVLAAVAGLDAVGSGGGSIRRLVPRLAPVWWAAVAAVLALAVGLGVVRWLGRPAGGPDAEFTSILARADRDTWPRLGQLDELGELPAAAAQRGLEEISLEAVAPRWTAIRHGRPTFELAAPGLTVDGPVTILVTDQRDQLVARFDGMPSPSDGRLRVGWPADTLPLAPGEVFAWKARVPSLAGPVSTGWVPFEVLAPDDRAVAEGRLERAADDPILVAAVLGEAGLLDEAEAALAGVDVPAAEPLRRRLAARRDRRAEPRDPTRAEP